MASLSILSIAIAISTLGQAAPTTYFPINAQVPPVARIAQPFSFPFSAITFTSDLPITYTLANPPKWLSVDSDGRRLYGTPQDEDVDAGEVVGVPIELVATDEFGSTTMSSTLVVCRNPAPEIQVPLSEQISNFGNVSGPSSILSYPDKPISFAFAKDTFSRPDLNYYAVSGNNAPMPSWLTFDASNLSFTGTTPPLSSLVEPPQAFDFQLVASDIVGFSGIAVPFSIVVGNREISTENTTVTLNATSGTPLSYKDLQGSVNIDGKVATAQDITSVETPGIPDWLTFDKSSWEISGTPPTNTSDSDFSIIFSDAYLNKLNVTVKVAMVSDLFSGSLPSIKVQRGRSFDYDLGKYLRQPSDVDLSIRADPPQDWIKLDSETMKLAGDVPSSLEDAQVKLSVQAKSKSSGEIGTQMLTMQVVSGTTSTSSASSTDPTATSDISSATSEPTKDTDSKGTTRRTILLAVLIPLLLLLLALILLLLCLCRRRRQRKRQNMERKDISGPVPGSFVYTSGSSEAASSMHEVNRHNDMVRQGAYPSGYETPGLAITTSSGHMGRSVSQPDIPPVPPLPPGTARSTTMRSFSEGAVSPRNSWAPTPTYLARPAASRSGSVLSDFSLYDDMSEVNSTMLFGSGSRDASFRNGIEPSIPVIEPSTLSSSIQHTPELAYGDSPAPLALKGPGASRISNSPYASSQALPTRPASSLASPGLGTFEQKPPKPWMKGQATKLMSSFKSSKLSNTSTVDTFADKTAARNMADEESVLARPRPLRIVDKNTISRPVSRRGDDAAGSFFGGSQRHRPLHGPYSAQLPPPPEDEVPEIPPLSTARLSRQQLARTNTSATQTTQTTTNTLSVPAAMHRNPFDVSYEDLVSNAPFHPSQTWTTVASGEELTSSSGGGSGHGPNWTVVVESPASRGAGLGGGAMMSGSGTCSDESGGPFGGSQGSGKWMGSGRAPLSEVQVTSPRTLSSSVGGHSKFGSSGRPSGGHNSSTANNTGSASLIYEDDEGYHENAAHLEKVASSRSGSVDRLSGEDEDFAVYI